MSDEPVFKVSEKMFQMLQEWQQQQNESDLSPSTEQAVGEPPLKQKNETIAEVDQTDKTTENTSGGE